MLSIRLWATVAKANWRSITGDSGDGGWPGERARCSTCGAGREEDGTLLWLLSLASCIWLCRADVPSVRMAEDAGHWAPALALQGLLAGGRRAFLSFFLRAACEHDRVATVSGVTSLSVSYSFWAAALLGGGSSAPLPAEAGSSSARGFLVKSSGLVAPANEAASNG